MRVIVIGAGLAGLSAAVTLRNVGMDVQVWDDAPTGGKARTLEPAPGWSVEHGPHTFTGRADAVFDFAERLGLSDSVRKRPSGARYILRDGRLKKAPVPALRVGELVALVRGLFRTTPPEPDETIDAWVRRTFGDAVAAEVVAAFTTGVWACRTDEVALDAGFPNLAALLREKGSAFRAMRGAPKAGRSGTYGFAGGMGELAMAAAARAGRLVPRRAHILTRTAEGWLVDGDSVDAVVVATDAPHAAALVRPVAASSAAAMDGVRYSPLLVAHWLSADCALPHGFGWLTRPADKRPVMGTIFASDVDPSRCPAGQRAFTSMLGGTIESDALELDSQGVERRIKDEVRALTGSAPTLTALHVVRHPRAVAIPGPGHARRVAAAIDALPPGLVLAGAWMGTGAMPDAIESGRAAAARLAPEAAHVG